MGLIGGFNFFDREYSELPFELAFALDNNEKAIKTYNKNFDNKALVMGVEDLNPEKMPKIDMVVGGFPCQSFSTVNPGKDPFDERGQLYKKMAKVLIEKQPKFFIAENVKGMLVLQKGQIFKNVYESFSDAGYKLFYKLLNAADFGVPQKRQRVFIVGIRNDINMPFEFPKETHSEKPLFGQKQWLGLSSVIEKLEHDDEKYYFSKKAVEGMRKAKNNMKRGLAQNLNAPCLTITSHLAKVSINSRDPVLMVDKDKDLYRRFTPNEAARIQSFPDTFKFTGTQGDAYRQIGNAIPPVLMWHVANALAMQWNSHTRGKRRVEICIQKQPTTQELVNFK